MEVKIHNKAILPSSSVSFPKMTVRGVRPKIVVFIVFFLHKHIVFTRKLLSKIIPLLYLPECREILWFSYGSAAAAGYGGYAGYGGGGGGYREISTFVCLFVCLFVNSIPEKLLDGF